MSLHIVINSAADTRGNSSICSGSRSEYCTKLLAENAEREGKRQRIMEMTESLSEQEHGLMEYDEQLIRMLIEKITVHEDRLTVEFKSGVGIDVEI